MLELSVYFSQLELPCNWKLKGIAPDLARMGAFNNTLRFCKLIESIPWFSMVENGSTPSVCPTANMLHNIKETNSVAEHFIAPPLPKIR